MPFLKSGRPIHWTQHSREKMRFYRLSEARVKRVIHSPRRIEEGIAPKTVALMQPASLKFSGNKSDWTQEIWVMIQDDKRRRKVISAWRFPGKTKPRDDISKEFLRREYDNYVESDG